MKKDKLLISLGCAMLMIGLNTPVMAQHHNHKHRKDKNKIERVEVNEVRNQLECDESKNELPSIDRATLWADSLMEKMTLEQKIAQTMLVRVPRNMSHKEQRAFEKLVKETEVGGVCFFAGTAPNQLAETKRLQSQAKVPLLISIDGEWGLGMRLRDCYSFPRQMLMGALPSEYDSLIYQVGVEIGKQCRKMGIHINFAPVVDLNSNPKNPVIGMRSFGENPERVSHKGVMYMKGMQSQGVVAVAKHFPGHGDTEVDSHEDLPVINHSKEYIDSIDLYPFRQMVNAGVGGVMIGHLHIAALDDTPHLPASLSHPIITDLLRQQMGFEGLVITDGLDMHGVTKYFKNGQGELKAMMAGNDILLLPPNIKNGIQAIVKEVDSNPELEEMVDYHCRKVLKAKYACGLNQLNVESLSVPNKKDWERCDSLSYEIALRGVTLLNGENWKPGVEIPIHYSSPYRMDKDQINKGAIVLAYQDTPIIHKAVDSLLSGKYPFMGGLPVSAAGFKEGAGMKAEKEQEVSPYALLKTVGMDSCKFQEIDSIVMNGIENRAYPGCRLLVAKDGKVVYNRAYGHMTYDENSAPVELNTMYDLASLTKVAATTLAVMKLVDEGKVDLDAKMSTYLPYLKHSNKKHLTVKEALSHFGRLKSFSNFYTEAMQSKNPREYVLEQITESRLLSKQKYVYSDFGFILLADMVEKVSGKPLDVYMNDNFYQPLGLQYTAFNPLEHGFDVRHIAPTENDTILRHRQIHGTVHDQNAEAMGGVSGHAGLFMTADDLCKLYQMVLNGGEYNDKRYLSSSVIEKFNKRYYAKQNNRRALGFDKPFISDPSTHVAVEASQESFGHTGFTGTMLWVDPEYDLIYIFLSNRVYPNASPNKLAKMNIRTDIQSLIYQSIEY